MLCLAGTMTSPSVYDLLPSDLPVKVVRHAWMELEGPWDLGSLACGVVERAEALGGSVLLAGHSTGGAIALATATRDPRPFAGLVLSGTGANMSGHPHVDTLLHEIATNWNPAIADRVVELSYHRPPSPPWDAVSTSYARRARREVVLEVLTSQRDTDLVPLLASLTLPVVIAHGTHDLARPMSYAEQLVDLLPDAELIVLGTGHTPMFEDPEGYAAAVRQLLDRC
jgi:pimeloyl-ACP methyl ester carboxylesterase